jgi:CarD family transcriptional regulator
MNKVLLEHKEGDYIVHATHGVGKITGIESKHLDDEKRVFYVVKTNKLTYWLPVMNSQSNRIRQVCAPSTFKSAVSEMRHAPEPLSNNFRKRLRYIKEEMEKSSVSASARLIRDLHGRNAEKNLHVNEHRTMDKLKDQFVSEWAISADLDKTEARAKMEEALSQSVAKMIEKA